MPPSNIMTPDFLEEIVKVIEEDAIPARTEGIILTGAGRHFSSGADVRRLVEYVAGGKKAAPLWYRQCRAAFQKLYQTERPVVSAIRGFCIGSGFELALASHLRFCEQGSRVGLVEAEFDLLPGVRGTIRLSQLMGMQKPGSLFWGRRCMMLPRQRKWDLSIGLCRKNRPFTRRKSLSTGRAGRTPCGTAGARDRN